MTGYRRVGDVHGRIFEVPAVNGGFPQEQTLVEIEAMSEARTKLPDAGAAKIASIT